MPSGDRICRAVVAGLCGSIAHSLLMYFKSWAGLLPSFQPYHSLQTTLSPCNRQCNPSSSVLVAFIPEWLNHHQFCLWTSLSMAARQRWCDQRNCIRCVWMGDYGPGFLSYDRSWVLRTPGWTWHFTRTVLAGNAPNLQRNPGHSLRRTQYLTCLNVISACPFGIDSGHPAMSDPSPLFPQ